MKPRGKRDKKALGQMLSVLGVLVFSSFFLIMHVWLPVQGERSLSRLRGMEKKISMQKASLQKLQTAYLKKTSLTVLDDWAERHGPWRTPGEKDIVTIYE